MTVFSIYLKMKVFFNHLIKIILIPLFIFSNSFILWKIIKLIQVKFNFPLKSLFIYYSPNERSTSMFFYKWFHLNPRNKWKLMLCGIHKQDNGWGLNFFLNIDEKDLISPKNEVNLINFVNDMNEKQKDIGIKYLNYAGIFPSIIKKINLSLKNSSSEKKVAMVVSQGIFKIIHDEKIQLDSLELILLGGNGLIGSEIKNILNKKNINYIIIEKNDQDKFKKIIQKSSKKIFLLNISRQGVLEQYDKYLNNNILILNEVFPPPRLKNMNNINEFYHVKGIKAKSYPNLLSTYKGAYDNCMPCCALVMEDENNIPEIVLTKFKK